jgi:GDPmannose 4,6-dehydratase
MSHASQTALICGVTGQDGTYLAKLLLEKGYHVIGTTRDAHASSFRNLEALGIRGDVECRSMAPNDFRSVLQAFNGIAPDEIYCLAGQSSVGLSFEQPMETIQSIVDGTLHVLEAVRFLKLSSRLFHAASSEAFGDTPEPADETTPFRPRSPYGIAKASAFWLVSSYREAYGLHASNGILFNHESPLRPDRFVTMKIIRAVKRIAAGSDEKLHLGNLDIIRDWGWAPEYCEAMWRVLQQPQPSDYVIASGEGHRLSEFVAMAFQLSGLDWQQHVETDASFLRPYDIPATVGNPTKSARVLGWKAQKSFEQVVQSLLDFIEEK